MPAHVAFFYALLASTVAYASVKGGGPERVGATLLAVAALSTWMMRRGDAYLSVQVAVAIIDMLLLSGLIALSLLTRRDWPQWAAAFQLVTTTGHLMKAFGPPMLNTVYALVLILSAYPTVLLLLGGVWNHQRRKRGSGFDPSWTRLPRCLTWLGAGGR